MGPKKGSKSFPREVKKMSKKGLMLKSLLDPHLDLQMDPKWAPNGSQIDPKSVDPSVGVFQTPLMGGKVYLPPYPPSCWACFSDIAKNMHRRERIAKVRVSLVP